MDKDIVDRLFDVTDRDAIDDARTEIATLRNELDRAQDIALFLFSLLDDIDTASDEAKDNHEWYRKRVEHIHRKRFEVMETDGYDVKVKNV